MADRFGRKRVLFIVTGLWGLWTATGFANSWTMLLVLYSIALIGTVASEPILNGLLGSLYRRSERGRAYALVRATGAIIGFIITPLIGQFGANPRGLAVRDDRHGRHLGGVGLSDPAVRARA